MSPVITRLNNRERAALQAAARNAAEITCSDIPDLFVDGLAFCDQSTAHELVSRGLIAVADHSRRPDKRVRAVLTEAGAAALRTGSAAAS